MEGATRIQKGFRVVRYPDTFRLGEASARFVAEKILLQKTSCMKNRFGRLVSLKSAKMQDPQLWWQCDGEKWL